MRLAFALVFLVTVFSGCATTPTDKAVRQLNHDAEASGSPYRYRVVKDKASGGSVIVTYSIAPSGAK